MKSYLNKYFINQSIKTKIVNTVRLILAVIGIFWLVPGFLEREV